MATSAEDADPVIEDEDEYEEQPYTEEEANDPIVPQTGAFIGNPLEAISDPTILILNKTHRHQKRENFENSACICPVVPMHPQSSDEDTFAKNSLKNPALSKLRVKSLSSSQLEDLLRQVRSQAPAAPEDDGDDDNLVLRLGSGERLAGGPEEDIGSALYELAKYRGQIVDNEEDLEEAAERFLRANELLLQEGAKQAFLQHKGLELMMILYKQKGQGNLRSFVVKTLDFAMSNSVPICNRFIELGGLPVLFSFFMKKDAGEKKRKKKGVVIKKSQDEVEEDDFYCLSLITNILICVSGANFDRSFYKFKENSFEKLERLVELYKYYLQKVRSNKQDLDDESDGYRTLQLISFLLTFLWPNLLMDIKVSSEGAEGSNEDQEIDARSILFSKLNDDELNKHLDLLISIHNINKEVVLCAAYEIIKTVGIPAIQRYLKLDEDASPKAISERKFKTVSQNPSESESEESMIARKRFKVSESEESES